MAQANYDYRNKNYGQIWTAWSDKFVRLGVPEQMLKQIHVKWKKLGSEVK